MPDNHGEQDLFGDDIDEDEDEAGHAGEVTGSPPGGYPLMLRARSGHDGHPARRGLLIALTAVVAAAAGFGVAAVAIHDVSGSPAASGTPSTGTPGTNAPGGAPSSGGQFTPQGGGIGSVPAGGSVRLEVGGPVTAVSATSITLGSGDRAVTAAVTRATRVTGRVTRISGIKVGDLVSASISGTGGKLTADSIQDPSAGPGQ